VGLVSTRRKQVDPIAVRVLSLTTVQRLGERRRTLEVETQETLLRAYAAGGVTWTQLGAALGVTGSVAWHLAHPAEPDAWEVPPAGD
jgi:hypothetical protein